MTLAETLRQRLASARAAADRPPPRWTDALSDAEFEELRSWWQVRPWTLGQRRRAEQLLRRGTRRLAVGVTGWKWITIIDCPPEAGNAHWDGLGDCVQETLWPLYSQDAIDRHVPSGCTCATVVLDAREFLFADRRAFVDAAWRRHSRRYLLLERRRVRAEAAAVELDGGEAELGDVFAGEVSERSAVVVEAEGPVVAGEVLRDPLDVEIESALEELRALWAGPRPRVWTGRSGE